MPVVTYGTKLRLQHHVTDRWLHSHFDLYTHPGSSGQQVVVAVESKSSRNEWVVKGPHAESLLQRTGQAVHDGAIIRLDHVDSRRNLHSHVAPSPATGQQEVTCYGENGVGNPDDNWRLEVEGGAEWTTEKRIRLIHVNTNAALHSHGGHHWIPQGEPDRRDLQEVTAYGDRDSNDFWVAADLAKLDNPNLRQLLATKVKQMLTEHNSEAMAWYSEGSETEPIDLGPISVGSITYETKTWVWLDDPAINLSVDVYGLILLSNGELHFGLRAHGKAKFNVWGKIPKMVTGDVKGTFRAEIVIEGSASIAANTLKDANIYRLDGAVSDVRFSSEMLSVIQGLIRDVMNRYIDANEEKIKQEIVDAINGQSF
jgi:dolichyl-phosphate-mannose--protein O-mannosyl transferase